MEASDQRAEKTPAPDEGLSAHDPSQDSPAELTDEQKAQAEREGTQGEQGDWVQEQAAGAPAGPGPDTPVATSAPDPARQSGVPLASDRAAGVEPGPVQPGNEGPGERPPGADPTSPSAATPNE